MRNLIAQMTTAARRPGWRGTGFGLLWGARTVSLLGDRITMLAFPFAAVAMGASPLEVSAITAASFVPWLLTGTFAGVSVDRSARYRRVMTGADLGRAALLLSVPAAALGGVLSYWQLLVVAFLCGALSVFFEAANSAFVPVLVGPEQLQDCNAKLSASGAVMQTVGPGLGGLLIQSLTARFAIAVDALSFLVSASLLGRIPDPPGEPAHLERRPFLADVRAGLSFIVSHPMLRAFVAEAATSNVGAAMNGAIVVLFAVHELHLAAGQFGVAVAVFGVGGGLGSMTAGRLADWLGTGPVIAASCAAIGVGGLLVGLAAGNTVLALSMLTVAYFVWGAAFTVYVVVAGSLRQAITPERMRARVMSTSNAVMSGLNPVGAILGGLLATWLGLRIAVLTAGVLMLVSVAWLLPTPVMKLRTMAQARDAAPGSDPRVMEAAEAEEPELADEANGGAAPVT